LPEAIDVKPPVGREPPLLSEVRVTVRVEVEPPTLPEAIDVKPPVVLLQSVQEMMMVPAPQELLHVPLKLYVLENPYLLAVRLRCPWEI
jgi:hypothetical protein